MVLLFGYLAKIVDVETAFLYGDLKGEIYMECPQGIADVKKDDCHFEQVYLQPCSSSL